MFYIGRLDAKAREEACDRWERTIEIDRWI